MLQRWMKSLAVVGATCALFASCKKNTYSPDEPLVSANTPSVFTSGQNKIMYGLEPSTGSVKWQFTLDTNLMATPVVVGSNLYIPTLGLLYQFDARTGKRGQNTYTVGSVYSSPITDGKTLYVASISGIVTAIDVTTNDPTKMIRWTYDSGDSILSSLLLYNGSLIVATTKGKIQALNIANGTNSWTSSLPAVDGGLRSSPVASGSNIYIGSPDYNLYALNVANGAVKWSYKTDGIIHSSPIAYGGNVIFGSADNYVYCIDSTAKTERWKFKTNDRVHSSPAAYGQVVYIGGYDSYLYALNIIDGSIKWKYQTGGLIQATSLATDGSVYTAGYDKYIYKFDTSGNLRWKRDVGSFIISSPVYYDVNKAYYPSITGFGPY